MSNVLLLPVKFLGWTAVGLGLAVGWKVGSYLVDVAFDKDVRDRFFETTGLKETGPDEPLWKRQFSKVSED